MRLVCISDTHGLHDQLAPLPDGDVLIHAGDATNYGTSAQLLEFARWFGSQPHPHKILINGNHDFSLLAPDEYAAHGITHLHNSLTIIDGVRFYGSPYTPAFGRWAFMLRRGAPCAACWELIPTDTDVLITHGPPQGTLDQCRAGAVGCADLTARLAVIRPKVHVFGHVHEGAGRVEKDGTTSINASVVDGLYQVCYAPTVVDI